MPKIIIYGANGYTGKLFAKHLIANGVQPILAGRSTKVESIAHDLKCESRVFTTDAAASALQEVDILVNLAGPFAKTQNGLIEACIQTQTHYLDIAGEVPEMENAYQYQAAATEAGIVVIPGAGFGVVPTDIAAALAVKQLDKVDQLTIAYASFVDIFEHGL